MHPLIVDAESVAPWVIESRRRMHRQPELGLSLPQTQALVVEALGELGIAYRTGASLSSVVGVIEGAEQGADVLLRADMDALPQNEQTELDFSSEVAGAMHACGHDTHVAMLLGAARLLASRRGELAGRVTLMFQPGEEGYAGAKLMLEEGLLDGLDPAHTTAFALHITAAFEAGTINLRPGPILAAPDYFEIDVLGKGGHAAEPHRSVDPVPVAAEIVLALHAAVTRRVDAFDPAVLTVTRIAGGTTHNVIPDKVTFGGTIRTVSGASRDAAHDLLHRVANNVAAAHGATSEVRLELGYPVTSNDAEVARFARDVATDLVGPDAVHLMPVPRMGGEDFAYVLAEVPGALAFLGGRPPGEDPATFPTNHSSRVVFDESALATGVAMHVAVALGLLGREGSSGR